MKKHYHLSHLTDELSKSVFFQEPDKTEEPPEKHHVTKAPELQSDTPPHKLVPMEETKQRSTEGTNERTKIRHTFDILADQLISLREIALEREKSLRKRVLIGDLVQEALDMLITKERNIYAKTVRA